MKAVLFAVAAVVVVTGIIVGAFAIQWGTAPIRGKLQAREEIQSGPMRITAYNHFYDLCASVQASEAALDAQREELSAVGANDRDRVLANIAGIQAERLRTIHQYNADARKSYTIGQFRSSDLPYQLPVESYKKGEQTSCAA